VETNDEHIQIIDTAGIEVFEAQERASIDTQVATAKRYPRNLRRVLDSSVVIATMNKETAKSCRYAKPVGGKNINGPSVHLARIIVQQYGNIRIQQRIKSIDARSVVAEAVAFDMETNYAVCVEARRSIIDKGGKRYSDSVIETNAMAIMAIAERNAIFKVVPKSLIDHVYNEAFNCAFGELTDNTKLLKERDRIFRDFKNTYGLTEEEVLKSIGVNTKEAITPEHIADLVGFIQALKDKELTPDDIRNKGGVKKTAEEKKADLKADIKAGKNATQPTLM
jgi:hypothetical protein